MSKESRSSSIPSLPGAAECQAFTQSTLQQGERWISGQMELCARLQAANARWLEHRQRDLDNGIAALRQLSGCRDFGEATAIQQKWLAECTHSLIADWTALMSPFAEHTPSHAKPAEEVAVSVHRVSEKAAT